MTVVPLWHFMHHGYMDEYMKWRTCNFVWWMDNVCAPHAEMDRNPISLKRVTCFFIIISFLAARLLVNHPPMSTTILPPHSAYEYRSCVCLFWLVECSLRCATSVVTLLEQQLSAAAARAYESIPMYVIIFISYVFSLRVSLWYGVCARLLKRHRRKNFAEIYLW